MDWMPTLLAAAGAAPDPAFPPDGINLLPVLTQDTAPVSRKLFWRYKANAQRAVRDGDYKYLKILDNTFLFNVVDDPMERANLKDRRARRVRSSRREVARLECDDAAGGRRELHGNFTGDTWADHIGAPKASSKADNPVPPKKPGGH